MACDISNAKDIVEEVLQYLNTAEFAMREELALKVAILAEKFAPDLSWYVDVILQLIDKAGDFVSDDIWYRVVQFVTNNEDLQPYAAAKARVYLEKPALHETMVKVGAYLLGEYGHLLARRPGCSPKELFSIINEKLPTVSPPTVAILLSSYAKMLMHTHPPDSDLQDQILAIFKKYESYIDVEIQQRAVEYFLLSQKGAALMDVLAEMPKFPERQSALLRKAEDVEADTAEQSAIRLQKKLCGARGIEAYGAVGKVDLEQAPSPDLLGDLLGPLAIEGPPSAPIAAEEVHGLEPNPGSPGPLALASLGDQLNTVQPTVNIEERFNALCLKDSGVLYEDPHIQIGVKAEWRAHHGRLVLLLGNKNVSPHHLCNAHLTLLVCKASRDVPVLDFFLTNLRCCGIFFCPFFLFLPEKNIRHLLQTVIRWAGQCETAPSNCAQQISTAHDSLCRRILSYWKSIPGPPTKLQEVVRGVKALSLPEMANLFASLHLGISQGLDLNPNNLVASATFYSENSRSILCLIRVETDPADRTQLRLTVASGDPILTFELKELIKEYLISIPLHQAWLQQLPSRSSAT
ncbi:hypothetical protein HPP92_027615 [Vanilla planifolia]|uniref:Uncharacterized protein n=1 Tax=Vanilla planifolia TaxID=51239 RepID=A0A835PBX6_VANPL|nr:hypothetical protein HPP92_027615 [Vanilla planifolia]